MPLGPFLILAILVLTPLALGRYAERDPARRTSGIGPIRRMYLLSAPLACAAILLERGPLAAALAVPWLVFGLAAALHGVRRLLTVDRRSLAEACMDIGLVYLSVGAAWLVLWRSGWPTADFGERTTALTAIHFHYAGFAANLIAGLVGHAVPTTQRLARVAYKVAAAGIAVGPTLVALGIAGVRTLESIGPLLLATSVGVLGLLILVGPARRSPPAVRAAFIVSAASAIFAMALVAVYVASREHPTLSSDQMATWHGTANALGFSLGGVVAFAIASSPRRRIPFSALRSRWRVGPDYFERTGMLRVPTVRPRGLVDSLADLAADDMDVGRIDPRIRAFYEDTERFDLRLFPRWRRGLGGVGRLYAHVSAGLEQVHYDLGASGAGERVHSRIVALDPVLDGRPAARGWVRTYERTGRSIYVAAYAVHRDRHRAYMNIAFPLPGGNLASILRVHDTVDGGLMLTSLAHPELPGDEGVYFANVIHAIRMPIDERIRVWPAAAATIPADLRLRATSATSAFARHDVWILAMLALTLDYAIDEVSAARAAAPTGPGGR